jgi:hypothetical protein
MLPPNDAVPMIPENADQVTIDSAENEEFDRPEEADGE